ncbi:MAG: Smr/MutS family protein [Ferruginibacter sp.]
MKYQVGDKIIVLHSDEEGIVVELMNERMVMIEVRGVKFPAYMDQIDFPYFKMFSQKKVPEKKKIFIDEIRREKTPKKKKIKDGVDILIVPVFAKDVFDDEVVDKLKIYLVNHNEEAYTFHYYLNFAGEVHFELKASVESLSDIYLHDVDFEDVSDNPKFEFEFSLLKPDKKKAEWFEAGLKLKGKQLFKKIEELQLRNEASFSYQLFEFYPDRKEEERVDLSRLGNAGFRIYDAGKARDYQPPALSVVDLHIEKISDSYKHLKPFEILSFQLDYFEKYYDLAVANYLPSLIMIHGVGEGRLRDELHEILRLKKNVSSFVNQFHPLYGYGATEITLKYI